MGSLFISYTIILIRKRLRFENNIYIALIIIRLAEIIFGINMCFDGKNQPPWLKCLGETMDNVRKQKLNWLYFESTFIYIFLNLSTFIYTYICQSFLIKSLIF